MTEATPFWHPDRHKDRRPFLLARTKIARAIRDYFEAQAFLEVQCGALQVSPGNETHLQAMRARFQTPGGETRSLYLHTSPEFACKKLLAAGETRLFTLAQVYRGRERGPLHAPEFCMLEWYRAHVPYRQAAEESLTLLRLAADAAGTNRMTHKTRSADPFADAEWLTVDEAFARHARVDLLATVSDTGLDTKGLKDAAERHGLRTAPDDTWSDVFSRILSERVEPHLGQGRPTLLYEYPVPEAALARPCPHDPRVAERFELYVAGVELANGFGELTDATLQRARLDAQMAEKERVYHDRYPLDESFLEALTFMPDASGVAMGFDRLVMLATGARHIDDVLWTPFPDV